MRCTNLKTNSEDGGWSQMSTGTGQTAWAQLLANAVTPNAHAPQMHQHQLQNSDAMDVDRGGRWSSAQML